jgi:hypothetical protein
MEWVNYNEDLSARYSLQISTAVSQVLNTNKLHVLVVILH